MKGSRGQQLIYLDQLGIIIHGVRDRWQAHCASMGIKSVIGNYRDNRFNALFETAAEIHLHKTDFLKILDTVETHNLKIKSVIGSHCSSAPYRHTTRTCNRLAKAL